MFLFLSSQSEFFCRLIYCTSTQCTSSSGTMSSHGNADSRDSRAHLLPAKFLRLIAKLRFVAHRSIVFTVSGILRSPWHVERLSGSNFFSHIEGAKCNSTQSSLQTSPRLKSWTAPHSLNSVPTPHRFSNYSSLNNAKNKKLRLL